MRKEITVPKHIIDAARLAVIYGQKSRIKVELIEKWLQSQGIDIDFMRDKDTILPYIEHLEFDPEVFQRDLDIFLIRYGDEMDGLTN